MSVQMTSNNKGLEEVIWLQTPIIPTLRRRQQNREFVHACNPKHSKDRKIMNSKPAWAREQELVSKTNKVLGV